MALPPCALARWTMPKDTPPTESPLGEGGGEQSFCFYWIYSLSAWNRAWIDDSGCSPVLSGTLENAKDTPTESLLDLLPVGMEQGMDG